MCVCARVSACAHLLPPGEPAAVVAATPVSATECDILTEIHILGVVRVCVCMKDGVRAWWRGTCVRGDVRQITWRQNT